MESAKLPALGYTSALEALAEKFHASPALLRNARSWRGLVRRRCHQSAGCGTVRARSHALRRQRLARNQRRRRRLSLKRSQLSLPREEPQERNQPPLRRESKF